jgi:hypothetical protein
MAGPTERISQAEKLAVLKNDRLVNDALARSKLEALFLENRRRQALKEKDSSTYLDHTHDEDGGRWAKPKQVTGREQAVNYPKLPASSPWSEEVLGNEPPFGVDINAVEPTGNWHELDASFSNFGVRGLLPADAIAEEQLERTEQDCSSDNQLAGDSDYPVAEAPPSAASPGGVEPPATPKPKLGVL